jgi:hypothetical protein
MTSQHLFRSVALVATITGALLTIPLVAMQFTDEVVWTAFDFAAAGALLFGAGLAYRLVTRRCGNLAYRAAVGLAVAAALALVWVNLAVGLIGSERNPANLLYGGVLAAGVIGALAVRAQPRGMARTLLAMALIQAAIAALALVAGLGSTDSPSLIVGANGFFVALFAASALLFRSAARGRIERRSA